MNEKLNIHQIVESIETANPLHAKKLKDTLSKMDASFFDWANAFLLKYQLFLKKTGVSMKQAISFYLDKVHENIYEMVHFFQTGSYRYASFQEVNQRVYSKPEVMNSYLYGLLLSQVLWKQHYAMFHFFLKNLSNYKVTCNYLEIGGGHGLFIDAATKVFGPQVTYSCLDISQTSLAVAKNFIDYPSINYIHTDIFKFNPSQTFQFISMGEVLEHVEQPKELLVKLNHLLTDDGTLFITVPTNAPDIDHIYLFNNTQEIRDLITSSGFSIIQEIEVPTEKYSVEDSHSKKICVMYAAFLKKI
jgi:2-polyprenyl-3-methyl-5-hydroxy-6-metoxy-1,4-benzoquinol methylase